MNSRLDSPVHTPYKRHPSNVILSKYAEALRYPRLRRLHQCSDAALGEIDAAFQAFTEVITPIDTPAGAVVEEGPDDDRILAAAVTGRVDCIIMGDKHPLTLGSNTGIPMLSPADFLARFFPD